MSGYTSNSVNKTKTVPYPQLSTIPLPQVKSREDGKEERGKEGGKEGGKEERGKVTRQPEEEEEVTESTESVSGSDDDDLIPSPNEEDAKEVYPTPPSLHLPPITLDTLSEHSADFGDTNDFMTSNESASFIAEFSVMDAFNLRNAITYLKGFHKKGNFRFTKDGIRFEEMDHEELKKASVFNQLEIEACELIKYEFYAKTPEVIIGLKMDEIHAITKGINKKDGVRIYKLTNNPYLYIQIVNPETRMDPQSNVSYVKPIRCDDFKFKVPNYSTEERRPNFVVTSTQFSKKCGNVSAVKCEKVTIQGFGRWIKMVAAKASNIGGKMERMGNYDDQVRPISPTEVKYSKDDLASPHGPRPKFLVRASTVTEGPVFHVTNKVVKNLSRLKDLKPDGNIKVYMEIDNPLKLVCRVGNYGTLRVYIKEPDEWC